LNVPFFILMTHYLNPLKNDPFIYLYKVVLL